MDRERLVRVLAVVCALIVAVSANAMCIDTILRAEELAMYNFVTLCSVTIAGVVDLTRNQWGEHKLRCTKSYFKMAMNMPDSQFRSNFRMNKSTFKALRQRLWEHTNTPRTQSRGRRRSPAVFSRRLLMTIWFLASGCTYRELSEQFGYGFSYRHMLVEEIASMRDNYISMPTTDAEVIKLDSEFAALRGFKGCLGAIDGTYIRILGPHTKTTNSAEYNNYKKFYGIAVLAVCDTHLRCDPPERPPRAQCMLCTPLPALRCFPSGSCLLMWAGRAHARTLTS